MRTNMLYREWCDLRGKNRWYHSDGTARTLLPLDYNWEALYKIITQDADMYFWDWTLPCDVRDFTSRFFAAVPTAWLRYKTMFEMFVGTLDGTSISPDVFEAGYTRTTTGSRQQSIDTQGTESTASSSERSSTQDNYTDSSSTDTDTKNRSLNYLQGAQGLSNINNGNIGQLGNKYASSIVDGVGTDSSDTTTNYGERTVSGSTSDEASGRHQQSTDHNDEYTEKVHETRINYYDNLAFLRERADRLKLIQPFHELLQPVFKGVMAFSGNW